MLGLGWTEMLVIGVVALIFIGPKDLPVVMGRIGKVMGQIRRLGNDFQREINRSTGLDEVRNLRNSITSPLKKTAEEIRKEFNTMTPTGPQPSGAIKPADPKAESVVEELRSAAGITPVKKSNDELATDYGFKPGQAKPAPVKAAQVAPKAAADTPVVTSDVAADQPSPAAKPVRAKKPVVPKAEKVPAQPSAVADKPAPRQRPKVAPVENAAAPAEPAKKPRATRKKPASPTGTT